MRNKKRKNRHRNRKRMRSHRKPMRLLWRNNKPKKSMKIRGRDDEWIRLKRDRTIFYKKVTSFCIEILRN
jgi:hypothetical protein